MRIKWRRKLILKGAIYMEKNQNNLKIVIVFLVIIILLLTCFIIFLAKEFIEEREEIRNLYS